MFWNKSIKKKIIIKFKRLKKKSIDGKKIVKDFKEKSLCKKAKGWYWEESIIVSEKLFWKLADCFCVKTKTDALKIEEIT